MRTRGLTLLELLLALAGTAVIGSAVAAMLTGVVYGTETDKDMRSLVTRQMALRARVEAEVREARMILDAGADYLILWTADSDLDGLPGKTEILVIEYDAALDRVMRYAAAPLISNTVYNLNEDFRTATNAYKGDSTFPGERWAEAITSFTITLDDLDPQSAHFVSLRFGMMGGDIPYTGVGAATVRNDPVIGFLELVAVEDTENRSGWYGNRNYGGDTVLRMKHDRGSYTHHTFIKFRVPADLDFSSFTSATLRLTPTVYLTTPERADIRIRPIADRDDTWHEFGLTWNNAPVGVGSGLTITGQGVTGNQAFDIDVLSLISGMTDTNGYISFHLDFTSPIAQTFIAWHSRQSHEPGYRPRLILE